MRRERAASHAMLGRWLDRTLTISPILTYVVIVPVAVAVGLAYYALVFAFFYRAWQDTLGGDAVAPPAEAQASHQIEL